MTPTRLSPQARSTYYYSAGAGHRWNWAHPTQRLTMIGF